MKTKELIKRLQEEDPSGEMDVCVGNADILGLCSQPAYWDGCLQTLIRDESSPYYNVIGARYSSKGSKICIHPLSISDAIFEDVDLPVEYDSEYAERHFKERVEHIRKESKEMNDGLERDAFVKYMVKRLAENYAEDFEEQEVQEAAKDFYNENMSHQDPMPEDILKSRKKEKIDGATYEVIPSWRDRRRRQWDREIGVTFEDSKLKLCWSAGL